MFFELNLKLMYDYFRESPLWLAVLYRSWHKRVTREVYKFNSR